MYSLQTVWENCYLYPFEVGPELSRIFISHIPPKLNGPLLSALAQGQTVSADFGNEVRLSQLF